VSRRLGKQWDEVLGFAFDHRNQFFDLAQQTGADEARIADLKGLVRAKPWRRRKRNAAWKAASAC
jgi:5-dehydro-2-deoxygluconokinase